MDVTWPRWKLKRLVTLRLQSHTSASKPVWTHWNIYHFLFSLQMDLLVIDGRGKRSVCVGSGVFALLKTAQQKTNWLRAKQTQREWKQWAKRTASESSWKWESDSACSRTHRSPYAKCRQVDSAGKVTLKAAAGPCCWGKAVFIKRGIVERNQSGLGLHRPTTLGILLPSSPKVLVLCKVKPYSQSQGRN